MHELVVQSSNQGMLAVAVLLMGVIVVLSLGGMVYMYQYFNKIVHQQNDLIHSLQKELKNVGAGIAFNGAKTDKFELKIKLLARRQYLYETQQMKKKNYERAKTMIQRGDKVEKVISDCNITKTEAELIMLAHRMNKVA